MVRMGMSGVDRRRKLLCSMVYYWWYFALGATISSLGSLLPGTCICIAETSRAV